MTAVVGLLLGLLMGLLLGLPLSGLPAPSGVAAARRVDLPRPGDAGPDGRQARGPDRRGRGGRPASAARPRDPTGPDAGDPRIVVDTSAIIDGRIAEIVESGFIYGTLVVPRFVLDELQHIADSSDTLRRNRGRRGLEILTRMQKEPATPVEIVEDDVPECAEVDAKLVALARARSRVILTNDFNLNRVAELQGVRVMNINSLANAVKPAVLPGEELRVRVIQEGKEAGQGVGFLDDGTMIVVEGGARHMDRELDVVGHARPPDRRRADDLRPAAARLSGCATSRRSAVRRATRSSWRPGARSGWRASTSSPPSIAGRPLLAWTLAAIAARRRSAGSSS